MIYPTARAVILMAAGAPLALLLGLASPGLWYGAVVWIAVVVALVFYDATDGARIGAVAAQVVHPRSVGVGDPFALRLSLTSAAGDAPRDAEVALAVDDRLAATGRLGAQVENGTREVDIPVTASRRGTARLERAWVRWRGPFGLVWKQRDVALDQVIAVTPDMRSVREDGIRLFLRDSLHGLMARLDRGDGTDFDALAEFRAGMDRRAIDWKQSARHADLLAKHYRTERNNDIVFAVDSGRAMADPVDGVPRVDRAVAAALLTAYVALKLGDRVGLLDFAARPRRASAMMTGARSFAALQQAAAAIDYSHDETNYTLALTTLAARLTRRSLIVVFTDFTDPAGADLLVRAGARLLERHVVMFVVIEDTELERAAARSPDTPADVARAVTAAALLRERRIVTARLRRLGIDVVEAAHDRVGPRLVDAYLSVKRRNLL